jgi:hypothetical protein
MSGATHLLPQYAFMAWYLFKHKDNFTFTFIRMFENVCNETENYIKRVFVTELFWNFIHKILKSGLRLKEFEFFAFL